jgi:membrane protein
MERLKTFFSLMKEAFDDWNRDKAPRLAAALAYYTAFSIAPLLIVVIAIAGLVFGQEAVRGQLDNQIQGMVGAQAADAIQEMVAGANHPDTGVIAAIIGVVTLLLGAAGLFGQLQDALNTVWGVEPKPNLGIVATIRSRLLSFTMVLGIGFLLLVSLVISAALAALETWMSGALPFSPLILQIINLVISLLVITGMFAVIFKVLPDAEIAWRDVLLGAFVTALLFTIGKFLIGLYLGHSSIASSYGAAGSFVVLLLWIYYSAQILLFGAEFTQVYARRYGSKIVPAENARFISAEDLAQQGQPQSALKKAGRAAYQLPNKQVAAQQTKVAPPVPPRSDGSLPGVILGLIAALASFIVGLLISNEQKN